MNDLTTARDALDAQSKRVFGDFVANGYRHLGTIYASTAALGQYLESVLENREAQRRIRVSYLPPIDPHSDAMIVFLENGATDSFAVDGYMRSRDFPADEIAEVTLSNHTGSLEERLGACLDEVKCVLDKHLSDVTSGTKWESVPINWQGHK